MNINNNEDKGIFTKDMLKDGMIVECVNGCRFLKLNENFVNNNGFMDLDSYDNNLILNRDDANGYSINKVFKTRGKTFKGLFKDEYLELIWEHKEKTLELTMKDIESKYGCKVKIVNK